MQDTIRYILTFLLYGNREALPLVGYTRDDEEAKQYKLNILPSENSPLYNPERDWRDFYPEVLEVLSRKQITPDTDIVSLSCFLLSRAEETVISVRDEHGRFSAEQSVLGRNNLLQIPLVDEYSRWLLKRLELPLPPQQIALVNLTHDVDILCIYRRLRGMIGGIRRGEGRAVWEAIKKIERDPAFTFPWMIRTDSLLQQSPVPSQALWFLKATDGKGLDAPQYSLYGHDFRRLIKLIRQSEGRIGLHTSYAAGTDPTLIRKEKHRLEKAIKMPVTLNRHHWLRTTGIDNMQQLAAAGITDDYSVGFADRAGFRIATTRSVRWINPKTLQLTPLTLHPLTAMDCTLSNTNYMNLTEDEAWYYCQRLIDKVRQNNGELTLLWHNSNLTEGSYHKSLYTQLIQYIATL